LKASYQRGLGLGPAVKMAVDALQKGTPEGGDKDKRLLGVAQLEVATLEQARPRRAFRRVADVALEQLLGAGKDGKAKAPGEQPEEKLEAEKPEAEQPSSGDPSNP
jgi:proteasome alpha subunit